MQDTHNVTTTAQSRRVRRVVFTLSIAALVVGGAIVSPATAKQGRGSDPKLHSRIDPRLYPRIDPRLYPVGQHPSIIGAHDD
jgi:hypothetical protein